MTTQTAVQRPVDLGMLLSQASYALATELTAALATLGVTPRSYCVLSSAMRGDFTQGQLAEMCCLDKTTMVVTLDELEGAGLAERRTSSADRRARVVAVTPAGAKVVARGRAIVDGVYDDVLSSLPERERSALVNGLARLVSGRLAVPAQCERPVRRRTPRSG